MQYTLALVFILTLQPAKEVIVLLPVDLTVHVYVPTYDS